MTFSSILQVNTPREKGGLGEMKIPILADKNMTVARDYGVLKVRAIKTAIAIAS